MNLRTDLKVASVPLFVSSQLSFLLARSDSATEHSRGTPADSASSHLISAHSRRHTGADACRRSLTGSSTFHRRASSSALGSSRSVCPFSKSRRRSFDSFQLIPQWCTAEEIVEVLVVQFQEQIVQGGAEIPRGRFCERAVIAAVGANHSSGAPCNSAQWSSLS